MSFRITSNMMFERLMSNIRTGARTIGELQEQMVSLRKINRPSDNPAGASRVQALRSSENDYAQYIENIDQARSMLNFTASALEGVSQAVVAARGKLLAALSPTVDAVGKEATAVEIDDILRSILGQANSSFGGIHIFGGTQTAGPPFSIRAQGSKGVEAVEFSGDSGSIRYVVGVGHLVKVNEDPMGIFMRRGEARGLFQTLIDVRTLLQNPDGLEDGDLSRLLSEKLGSFDAIHDDVVAGIGRAGARSRALQIRRDLYSQAELNSAGWRSEVEDIDIADVALRLQNQQAVFEIVLASSASVFNTNLMEFLR